MWIMPYNPMPIAHRLRKIRIIHDCNGARYVYLWNDYFKGFRVYSKQGKQEERPIAIFRYMRKRNPIT